jgi:hypothetical protein
MELRFDLELSKRELLSIGQIVALWASLEYEIFYQTLKECAGSLDTLPRQMNNMQFGQVLSLWENLVISKAKGKRQKTLQQQHEKIIRHGKFRNALVHGMWDWSKTTPKMITAIRVRKNEITSVQFSAEQLESFAAELQKINFNVRYPGGFIDFAKSKTEQGASISRLTLSLLTGDPIADELLRYSVPAPPIPRATSKRPPRRSSARHRNGDRRDQQ